MDTAVKKQWVEALDRYPQSGGALRNESGYCCLGVLCDLYDKAHKYSDKYSVWAEKSGTLHYTYAGTESYLPEMVMRWSDLEDNDPYIPEMGIHLSELNDQETPFSEIASVIQQYL